MQAENYLIGICGIGKRALDAYPMGIDEIKAAMAARGMKQVDLANALGIHPVGVNKSLKGTRKFSHKEMMIINSLLSDNNGSVSGITIREIPIIGQVVAGNWQEARQSPTGWLPIANDAASVNSFALRVVGDSMDLEIEDGGIVIVNPDDKALWPGRLYVVLNDAGESTFKQFAADPARLEPRSSNPAHRTIPIGDGPTFTLVGRVTALYRTR